ncbi:MAG: hypothetical protein J6L81_06315 [Clostridia bacterium]|nr:hypothetical protein [Clostridia bacterium]
MKKIFSVLAALMLVFAFAACGEDEPTVTVSDTDSPQPQTTAQTTTTAAAPTTTTQAVDTETVPQSDTIPEVFAPILSNRQQFVCNDNDNTMMYFDEIDFLGTPLTPVDYTVIDMDANGSFDLIVRFKSDDGEQFYYSIFMASGDTVCMTTRTYRAFFDLRADGIFGFSASAAHSGYATMTLENGIITHVEKAALEGNAEGTITCRIDGQAATQADFDAFAAAHLAKEEPTWHTFSASDFM